MSYGDKIDSILALEQKLDIKKSILIDKAMRSESPSDILKAQKLITANIEAREQVSRKSYIIDPYEFTAQFGYKDKPTSLSYDILERMARTPIINAIIKTRINQVADFCEPQFDRYSTGFVIEKKMPYGVQNLKPSKAEQKRAGEITDFIMRCGSTSSYQAVDFNAFSRMHIKDSLTFDQATWENIYNRKGELCEFIATDASTFRIADSYDNDTYQGSRVEVKGYYPNYVQILDGIVTSDYYPWELAWGVRNPSTSIYNAGYGISEIEEMVQIITGMLWADEYNRKLFSQGSMPKGFIRVDGTMDPKKIQEFRQQWNSMVAGVTNAHKTPILEAGKVDWIDLQKANREMEFNSWIEYQIKIGCAIFTIDPAEVNFPLQGGAEQRTMFEGSNEARLKHSKDKGLKPLLTNYQRRLNRNIVEIIDPEYQLRFVGMNADTEAEELEKDIKRVANFMTVNEVREKHGLKSLGAKGDVILNAAYMQQVTQEAQAKQQKEQLQMQQDHQYDFFDHQTENGPDEVQKAENPFEKAFNGYLKGLN